MERLVAVEAWPLSEPESVEKWESWIWDGLMRARYTRENLLQIHKNLCKELTKDFNIFKKGQTGWEAIPR